MTKVSDFKGKYSYGMRAMGAFAGTYHTNTREGYEHWRNVGIEFWETDVAITADGKYVMIGHFLDKATMNRMEITDLPTDSDGLTSDWYMSQKLFPKSTKGLTPLSIEDVLKLAVMHPDTVYMLDMYPFSLDDSYNKTLHFLNYLDEAILNEQQQSGSAEDLYDRIIVEAYNKEMFRAIHDFAKAKYVQMSIGKFIENEKIDDIGEAIKYARDNGVNVISYEWRYARNNLSGLKQLREYGFLFISRSVTNLFENKRKRRYGVNVALLDIHISTPLDIIELGRLFFSRIQKKHG